MPESILKVAYKQQKIKLNGVELNVITAGEQGPLLLFLHGFPEFWGSWRAQIDEFSRDYRVVAPDLRGYNESSKPENPSDYHLDILAQDIRELIQTFGEKDALIVGHDWGAIIAWYFAEHHPGYVRKLAVLSVCNLQIFKNLIRQSMRMRLALWHFIFFNMPKLPEFFISSFNFFLTRRLFKMYAGRKDKIKKHIPEYIAALAKPGVLKASLNYYRRNLTNQDSPFSSLTGRVSCPTLLLYGGKDPIWIKTLRETIPETQQYVKGEFTYQEFPEAGHWLPVEEPEGVNKALREFLEA